MYIVGPVRMHRIAARVSDYIYMNYAALLSKKISAVKIRKIVPAIRFPNVSDLCTKKSLSISS